MLQSVRLRTRLFLGVMLLGLSACASTSTQAESESSDNLDGFVKKQKTKIIQESVYYQAEFNFWTGIYEPTPDDLDKLQKAWTSHGQSFPESKSIKDILQESSKRSQRVVLVALYSSDFDLADLNRKELGWGVSPVPTSIKELSESDLVLRSLMPVSNPWARYFLLKYSAETWVTSPQIIISNRLSKVVLQKP
ncbi:MAG: hypothetical protein AB7F43_08235 [Bacteriovoracia bacterium]